MTSQQSMIYLAKRDTQIGFLQQNTFFTSVFNVLIWFNFSKTRTKVFESSDTFIHKLNMQTMRESEQISLQVLYKYVALTQVHACTLIYMYVKICVNMCMCVLTTVGPQRQPPAPTLSNRIVGSQERVWISALFVSEC